jgi:hypothetical protein
MDSVRSSGARHWRRPALTEAAFQPAVGGERVPDEVYSETSKHYDQKALAT